MSVIHGDCHTTLCNAAEHWNESVYCPKTVSMNSVLSSALIHAVYLALCNHAVKIEITCNLSKTKVSGNVVHAVKI